MFTPFCIRQGSYGHGPKPFFAPTVIPASKSTSCLSIDFDALTFKAYAETSVDDYPIFEKDAGPVLGSQLSKLEATMWIGNALSGQDLVMALCRSRARK